MVIGKEPTLAFVKFGTAINLQNGAYPSFILNPNFFIKSSLEAKEPVTIEFDTILFLPKLFITNFKSQYLTNYGGRRAISAQMIEGITFNGILRSEQQKAFDAIVAYYKVHNKINGILKLATGAGKTVLGLYTIAATRLKTIIIVDNEDLLNEWERSIYEFTNLTKQNVGLIKGNVFDVNKSIVIASSQTLVSKLKNDFDNFFTVFDNAGFGLAIFDEAHATSATVNTAKINVLLRTNNIFYYVFRYCGNSTKN